MEQIADYQIVESLGKGNNGEFFLAIPPARLPVDADRVALKVIAANTTDDAFRRATRELRAFAAVTSPYLVTLYDAGQQSGIFYYSMEYFALGSLASPARPLTRDETLRAVAHAAHAAHTLHEAGIAHRGIKPANILVHEDGAKLSDLGLAQVLAPGLTVTGIGGTGAVEYIDPVIIRGGRASRASDIWSLGVTLHRVIAGTGVYGELPDDDPLLAVRKLLTAEPEIDPGLDAQVAQVVEPCLRMEPSERPGTAEDVAAQIEALLGV
ncbi:MAG: serine/threonine protein kinase [Actinobacteria bacterium]|nr:serine/threonine protein kinase [Actinomycetota bacterium]